MSKKASPGFFTLGVQPDSYDLPHRQLGIPVILLIRRVLCRAFDILRQEKFKLADAKEDEVTAALRAVIENNLRQIGTVHGFNRRSFESVVRQGQVANYDGSRSAKTPDLCFKLRQDDSEPRRVISEYDALFVECKPVDVGHAVGSKYCDDGLVRFVSGDYAWAMQEGLMLAYARNGRTITGHLIPSMNETARISLLATNQLPEPYSGSSNSPCEHAEAIYISKHRRSFSWPDGKGQASDIIIYHLWHNCN